MMFVCQDNPEMALAAIGLAITAAGRRSRPRGAYRFPKASVISSSDTPRVARATASSAGFGPLR